MEGSDLEPVIPGLALRRVLGRGASADVYLATQEKFHRQVAVKVLTTGGTDQAERRMFATECRTLGQLSSHPDIVTVYDGDVTADGRPYLVMEYLPGGTLAERLRDEGRLDPEEVVAIGVKLAGALATAHAHGIVHGDVKPQNVLRSSSGNPVLADFGIARFVGGSASSTRLGAVTPLHAAPELLDGSAPDVRTDVYELASTLFELVDGRPAAGEPDEGPLTVIARIARRERRHLDPAGLPDGLAEAIEAGMAFDPDDRPATMVDFGQWLMDVAGEAGFPATDMVVLDAASTYDRPADLPLVPLAAVTAGESTLPPELIGDGSGAGWHRNRTVVGALVTVVLVAIGAWWVLRPSGSQSAGGTVTTTPKVSVPQASGPVDVTMTIPGSENLTERLESQLSDTSAIFAPVGPITAAAPSPGSGFYQTPMKLRYDAVNPLKEPGCGGFTSEPATLQGIWQRTVDYKDSSRLQATVMVFDTEEQAKQSFLVFSVMQGPTASECRGFDREWGIRSQDEAEIVHREPPLVLTTGGNYNSFTLGPAPERLDLTTVIVAVVRRGREVVLVGVGVPPNAPPGLDQRVAATVDNVLSRTQP